MDVLSDVLNAVRVRGAAYFDVNATAPWVSVSPSTAGIGHSVTPRGEHVIPLHVVMRGHAWVRPADRSLPIASLGSGDVIVFPYGQSHVMSSEPEPPELLAVDHRYCQGSAQGDEPFTLVEIGGRGERSESAECWPSGLRNERVGKVLQSIHAHPTEDWSLAGLAQVAGSSRSRLAADFRRYTGESPMRYLARWRMQLATHMLEDSAVSIAQAGQQVGYESEAAFKRAFRRHVGTTPGHWRRVRRATTQSHA